MTVFKKSNNASYDYKNNYNKDNFNKKVCSAMKKQDSKSALILDGKDMRSTSEMIRIGIKPNNITSIEIEIENSIRYTLKMVSIVLQVIFGMILFQNQMDIIHMTH